MSQSEPLTTISSQTAEQLEISPAVADIMERAHSGAMLKIEEFEAKSQSPVWSIVEKVHGTFRGAFNIPVNPVELSELVININEYKKQIAANEERFRNAA